MTNVVGSSVAPGRPTTLSTPGPVRKLLVASTKAYTTQLMSMYLLAPLPGCPAGYWSPGKLAGLLAEMKNLARQGPESSGQLSGNQGIRREIAASRHLLPGRGLDYAVAWKGPLNLRRFPTSTPRLMPQAS